MVKSVTVWKASDGSLHENKTSAVKVEFANLLTKIFHAANIVPGDDLINCLWDNRFTLAEEIMLQEKMI